MKKYRQRLLAIFLILIPAAVLLRIWYQRYGFAELVLHRIAEGQSVASQVQGMNRLDAVALWHVLPYTPISNKASFRKELSHLPVQFETRITPEQHQQLLSTVLYFLQVNSCSSAQEMRLNESYITSHHMIYALPHSLLTQVADHLHMDPSGDPAEIMMRGFEQFAKGPQIKGVCIPASSVVYSEYSNSNRPYAPINNANVFGNNESMHVTHRAFKFVHDFHYYYNRGNPVKVAQIMLYLLGRDGSAGPYVVRMWWCSKKQEWRPLQLVWGSDTKKIWCLLPGG
ncbi:MAG: hypothetical protein M1330_01875 [Armatimonadetes bacterium]|nr:hypothetical protein [Armatimonadota bacterium]